MNSNSFRSNVKDELNRATNNYGNDYIFFIGAGFSKRYLNLPGWRDLLQQILDIIESPYPVTFYEQSSYDLISAAESISKEVHKWAWGVGKHLFPEEIFRSEINYHRFMKILIAREIQKSTINFSLSKMDTLLRQEIDLFKTINTHTLITTNYDNFLESIFGYPSVYGKDTVLHDTRKFGTVLKPHGCCNNPESIAIFPSDYEEISLKHQYFFSKILTFFAEKPIIIMGYSLSDPDIKEILINVSNSLGKNILDNVFYVAFNEEPSVWNNDIFQINLDNKTSQCFIIKTKSYDWIFENLSSN